MPFQLSLLRQRVTRTLLFVGGVILAASAAAERIDAPGEVRVAVTKPSVQSEIAQRMGWLEQEFAKVNKRVLWVGSQVGADAVWEGDGRLKIASEFAERQPDSSDRFSKVVARTEAWVRTRER